MASFGVMYLAFASTGLDLMTSFFAAAVCMNIPGPGLGDLGANYANLNDAANWILCIAMLLGGWEIFTLPVLLPPVFWRHQGS